MDSCFYRRGWIRTDTPATTSLEPTTWMIFMDSVGVGKQISVQLSGADHQTIEVSPGKAFTRVGKGRYRIRPGCRADYDALITDITKRGNPPQKIVHLWCVSDGGSQAHPEEALELSFFSLFYLAQALGEQDLSGVDLAVISNCLQSVSGEPIREPLRATLFGPTRVIPKEFPGIRCRSIDCDPADQGIGYAAVQLIAELCSPCKDPVVAYRTGDRWIETLEPMELSTAVDRGRLKHQGVYLITGGLGVLGLSIAQHLVRNFNARVALVGRTPYPPPEQWGIYLERSAAPAHILDVIAKLVEIQSSVGDIVTICADVTKQNEMKRAVELTQEKFGKINGVIHAAGANENCPLHAKTPESAARVLSSKVSGTLVLDEVLRHTSLDFFALFSSTSSFKPTAEQIDCAAASAFLDAFATSRHELPAISINWGSPRGAGQAFERILSADAPPTVAVSPDVALEVTSIEMPRMNRVSGRSTDDVEGVLADWWQELLGLEDISLEDDFFELGGHSLIGVQLFSKIKKVYELDFGLATLFEARTIRELAKLIREARKSNLAAPRPWSPLVPIQPKGTRPRIYVISGVGGNVIKFHNLAFQLGEDQPMYGLLPRGLDGKDSYRTRVEDMAADYVQAVRTLQPEGPYHLVGYSFGGIVAFEVAQQIAAQGGQIGLLGLFDTIEWRYLEKVDKSLRPAERFEVLREHLQAIVFGKDRNDYLKKLITAKLQHTKYRLFHALGRPLPQKVGAIEEVNFYAAAAYYPRTYSGKLTLFRSTKRFIGEGDDEFLGWGALAAGGVEVHHVPSTHFNILKEPGVKVLAEELKTCLDREFVQSRSAQRTDSRPK